MTESFAKTTKKAILKDHNIGIDCPPNERFTSMAMSKHNETQFRRNENEPEIVRVKRDENDVNPPIPSDIRCITVPPPPKKILDTVPTVGFMGHRPVYRPPIVKIEPKLLNKPVFEDETKIEEGFSKNVEDKVKFI